MCTHIITHAASLYPPRTRVLLLLMCTVLERVLYVYGFIFNQVGAQLQLGDLPPGPPPGLALAPGPPRRHISFTMYTPA